MKLYTKIFIGMIVGAILGFLFGEDSPILSKDRIKTVDASKIDIRKEPTDSAQRFSLPPIPVIFKVIDRIKDDKGKEWIKVSWKVTTRYLLALKKEENLKKGTILIGYIDTSSKRYKLSASIGIWLMNLAYFIGQLFLKLLMMLIVPLIFASLVSGVASLGDVKALGKLGLSTLIFYLVTTAFAVTIGLGFANILKPGRIIGQNDRKKLLSIYGETVSFTLERAAKEESWSEKLLNIIPKNPVESATKGNMLQLIFFAIFFGISLNALPSKKAKPLVNLFNSISDTMIRGVHLIMKVAPWGVGALIAHVIGTTGFKLLGALLFYSLVVLSGLIFHILFTLSILFKIFVRGNIIEFWKKIRPAMFMAFSTSSSAATLPVSMEIAEEDLKLPQKVVSFVLPLGATVNMDGTALYQGVAVVFIAQVFGINLSPYDQLTVIVMATLASIGAAAVPGAGLITLAMVLASLGIPKVGIALILGVDRFLDMVRTVVNVVGDLTCASVVSKIESGQDRI